MPIYKTNKKKDGLTAYRVRVAYVDTGGKHKQIERTVYGAAEARTEEVKIRVQLEKKETASKRMTVEQLFDRFLAVKSDELRATTVSGYVTIFKNHILPYLGDIRLDKLSISKLEEWKEQEKCAVKKIGTKREVFRKFSTVLNYAVKMEYMTHNPLVKIGNFKETFTLDESTKKISFYTPEEFAKFIQVAKKEAAKSLISHYNYLFFMLAYFTGARMGEILALKWQDLDGNKLSINKSYSYLKSMTAPKNAASVRIIELPQNLITILKQEKERQKAFAGFSDSFFIIGATAPLYRPTIRMHLASCATKAGLHQIKVHDFRHSHASFLANNGINIKEIARRLGHSKIETTWQTYAHLYPKEEERAVSLLNTIKFRDF